MGCIVSAENPLEPVLVGQTDAPRRTMEIARAAGRNQLNAACQSEMRTISGDLRCLQFPRKIWWYKVCGATFRTPLSTKGCFLLLSLGHFQVPTITRFGRGQKVEPKKPIIGCHQNLGFHMVLPMVEETRSR